MISGGSKGGCFTSDLVPDGFVVPPFVHAAVPVCGVVFAADLGVKMIESGLWAHAKDLPLLGPHAQLVVDEEMLEPGIE